MRDSPTPIRAKRMTPPLLQVPPNPLGASQSVCACPLEASIFLSLPSAKKPMELLFGDQKGNLAPPVPGSSLLSSDSIPRTHSCTLPPVAAVKASNLPSGDTA